MSTIFDRLNQELEAVGRRAQAALDEGRLQIELLRHKRVQDTVARDLGLLVHRRERTGEAEPARIEHLMQKLDVLERDIARCERELATARGETVSVHDDAPPTRGETTEATENVASASGPVDTGAPA